MGCWQGCVHDPRVLIEALGAQGEESGFQVLVRSGDVSPLLGRLGLVKGNLERPLQTSWR